MNQDSDSELLAIVAFLVLMKQRKYEEKKNNRVEAPFSSIRNSAS